MKTFKFNYQGDLTGEIEIEATNADVAFVKAVNELKEKLGDGCYNGDLQGEDDE